jgi:hypothetical protein
MRKKNNERPKVTKEIKEMAKKTNANKWDSKTETMQQYIDRIAKQRR